MMKERFVEKRFSSEILSIIETADAICTEYEGMGFDLSLRQLYYQFVARGLLDNTEANYKRLGSIISDARLAGLIDWDRIKDRGRETVENLHWSSLRERLFSAARVYREDTWQNQPNHVEVMVEKQALEGVLEPLCLKLDIPFTANKGYSSSSAMYEIGKRLYRKSCDCKDIHIIYLGDHDPSGIDMTRDVADRLQMFAECDVNVIRCALDMDQIEEYNPPENPAKLTDSRAKGYIALYGYSSWELDALPPDALARIVEDHVDNLRDDDLYESAVAKQNEKRALLRKIAQKCEE